MEVLEPSLILDKDLDLTKGGCTQYHIVEGGEYSQPALSEADEFSICGVYEVYTGQFLVYN